ncbi:MAG: hypothetical protein AABX11_01510 [Nanoarchaeota archaeon]
MEYLYHVKDFYDFQSKVRQVFNHFAVSVSLKGLSSHSRNLRNKLNLLGKTYQTLSEFHARYPDLVESRYIKYCQNKYRHFVKCTNHVVASLGEGESLMNRALSINPPFNSLEELMTSYAVPKKPTA